MIFQFTQTNDVVHLLLQTHSIKSVSGRFFQKQIQIQVSFKNRLPDTETFKFDLDHSIDEEKSRVTAFESNRINCELFKVQNKVWTEDSVKFQSTPGDTIKRKYRNTCDWDRFLKQVEEEEKNEPKNDIFQELYASCDENARRAMIKSFTESKGTVLSMNWNEVGKDRVQPYDS